MNDAEINEIFDDYEAIRADGNTGDVNNEQTDANETESSQAAAVRKRIVRNPRPKLNADRLCGERGIPSLEKHFENVVFEQGKGHEKENLDKLMGHLEHWTHRLFPSLKFSESLIHIEKLGKKKPVQTCIKKLRLDMPILAEDFIHDGEGDTEDVQGHSEMDVNETPESAFDQLMKEHRETFPETTDIAEDTITVPSAPVSSYRNPLQSPQRPATTLSPPRSTVEKEELTEEQKQRIERNKMLAAERRMQKLAAMSASLASGVSEDVGNPSNDVPNANKEATGSSSGDLQPMSSHNNELSTTDFDSPVL